MSEPTPTSATVTEQAAAINRANALDRLRSLLGSGFSGSPVTTEYGAISGYTGQTHTGIDLAAAEGTPVQNPIGGTVESMFHDNAGGNQIIIGTPSGYRQVFAHLVAFPSGLGQGDSVAPGSIVGYVGQTGTASGPHLHYEVLKPGGALGTLAGSLDPLAFIGEFAGASSAAAPPTPSTADFGLSPDLLQRIRTSLGALLVLRSKGGITDQGVAQRLRQMYPDVPAATLQAIVASAGRSADTNLANTPVVGGASTALAQPLDALGQIAASVGRLTGDVTDPRAWARVGLTLAAVALIGAGLIFYGKSFR